MMDDLDNSYKDEKPIFIIGGGRSGTTLVRYILNAHPNIYIAEEISFHPWMGNFKGSFRKRLDKYFLTFSYVWLRQNPQAVLNTLPKNLQKTHFPLVYSQILKLKAKQYGRLRWGEKNPLLTTFLSRIFQDFPNAKVINVIRDPRANVFSHTTMPWSSPSLWISNILARINYKMVKKYGDKVLNIKLEDLINQPKQSISTLLDFIEEPWSDRLLDHATHTLKGEGIPFPWLSEASKSRKSKSKKWTDGLSQVWIHMIESTNREQMERFEYELYSLSKEVNMWDRFKAIGQDIPNIVYSIYRSLRMALMLAVTDPKNTWKIQEIMHSLNPRAWNLHPEWNRHLPTMDDKDIYKESVDITKSHSMDSEVAQ